MATQQKIIEMIGAMKTMYSYYAKDADVRTLVKTWTLLLKDYPDEAVELAFMNCFKTCKMPPTPADVIEVLKSMIKTNEPTDEEMWDALYDAIRQASRLSSYFSFTFIEANGLSQGDNARRKLKEYWSALPEKIQIYCGSPDELIRLGKLNEDDLKYEKNRFFKVIPTIEKRIEMKHELEMNPQVLQIVQSSIKMIGKAEE